MKTKEIVIVFAFLILVGLFFFLNNQKLSIGLLSHTPVYTVDEIVHNLTKFRDKTIEVSGKFYVIGAGLAGGFPVYKTCEPLQESTHVSYSVVDSQGYQLLIAAPNRQLFNYNNKDVVVKGVLKMGYDCVVKKPIWYLDLIKINNRLI